MKKIILFTICLSSIGLLAQRANNLNVNSNLELKAFEFTLGKWEFQWHHIDPQTRKVVDDGISYSNVYLIQDGATYADDFYKKNSDGTEVRGTTFRSYDSNSRKLRMRWMVAGSLNTVDMEGNVDGENIVLYRTDKQDNNFGKYRIRITFYDITKDSYKWKRDFIFDDGTVIEKTTFYEAKRVK